MKYIKLPVPVNLQLFASTYSNSNSSSNTSENSSSSESSSSGSSSSSHSHTTGGSTSITNGKTWAAGEVDPTTQAGFDEHNKDYTQSQSVTDAYNRLQEVLDSKPGAFSSEYKSKMDDIYNQIMNYGTFSYDFNSDQQYKQQAAEYQKLGKTAMQDTLGQASAQTGGYNSSYAQTAAQQTYNNYISELNSTIIPQLREQAYEQWQDQRSDLYNRYSITSDAYDRDYNQYRDTVSDWKDDRSFYQSAYQDERDYDYNKWSTDRDYFANEYWNEKNSEMDTYSRTDTEYWEDTDSESSSSGWENSIGNTATNSATKSTTNSSSTSTPSTTNSSSNSTKYNSSKSATTDTSNSSKKSNLDNDVLNTVAGQHSDWEKISEIYSLVKAGRITEEEAEALMQTFGLTFN